MTYIWFVKLIGVILLLWLVIKVFVFISKIFVRLFAKKSIDRSSFNSTGYSAGDFSNNATNGSVYINNTKQFINNATSCTVTDDIMFRTGHQHILQCNKIADNKDLNIIQQGHHKWNDNDLDVLGLGSKIVDWYSRRYDSNADGKIIGWGSQLSNSDRSGIGTAISMNFNHGGSYGEGLSGFCHNNIKALYSALMNYRDKNNHRDCTNYDVYNNILSEPTCLIAKPHDIIKYNFIMTGVCESNAREISSSSFVNTVKCLGDKYLGDQIAIGFGMA